MKKSEQYQAAMKAVLAYNGIIPDQKLEIIDTLLSDKRMAEYGEKEKAGE